MASIQIISSGLLAHSSGRLLAPGATLAHQQKLGERVVVAISLDDGSILATHWCHENGKCGIRWTRLHVDWPN